MTMLDYVGALSRIYMHGNTMSEADAFAIIDALEKQIPKKPNMEIEPLSNGCIVYHCDCPACGMFLTGHEKGYPRHCKCGQLLDWSKKGWTLTNR